VVVVLCEQENVGQHLFLLLGALSQQISRGPVDTVTEKSVYTLSEDWLLCQAQDFSPVVSNAVQTASQRLTD